MRHAVALAAIGSAAGPLLAPALASPTPRARLGASAVLPGGTRLLRRESARQRLLLTISLRSRDASGLTRFSRSVSTPGSQIYGDYLGVAQFARRFGAGTRAIQTVRAALGRHGLTVGATMANGLTLTATGTAQQVERTFRTHIAQVKLRAGRVAYANVTGFSLPATAAQDIQSVAGLDDVALARPQGMVRAHPSASARAALALHAHAVRHVATGGPQPCAAASTYALDQQLSLNAYEVYTADQIAAYYGFQNLYAQGDLGAGQTIALYEQQPYLPSDITTYEQCYAVNPAITPIDVDGGPGPYQPPNAKGGGGDDEVALDIEMLAGLAPSASIQVYQGPPQTNVEPAILSTIASTDQAKVVSDSFGTCEQLLAEGDPGQSLAEEAIFQEMAAQGQSFFAASADNGSETCSQADPKNTSLSVSDPASDPDVTAVGGTSLAPITETTEAEYVWNEANGPLGPAGASGGGLSRVFGMPAYQSGAVPGLGVINGNSAGQSFCLQTYCRELPDVSADADPLTGYSIYYDGDWQTGNGTSAASPLWAALTALTNAAPACRGRDVGFADPALYAVAGANYAANFHDITGAVPGNGYFDYEPDNDYTETNNGAYPTTPGYDMTTGLGSPIAGTLAASLCAIASPRYTVTVASPGAVGATIGRHLTLRIAATDSGKIPLAYTVAGLPAGLAISPSTGVISGTPTKRGVATVTVAATDGYTNTGSTRFRLSVRAVPPVTSRLRLTGLSSREPKLSFDLGGGDARLKSFTVRLPKGLGFTRVRRRLGSHTTVAVGRRRQRFTHTLRRGLLTLTLRRAVQR